MQPLKRISPVAFLTCGLLAAATYFLFRSFVYPLPPVRVPQLEQYTLLDLSSALWGVRRLGATIAWIQLLQYYGTPEQPLDKETQYHLSIAMTRYLFGAPLEREVCDTEGCHDEEHYHPQIEGGVYPQLLAYCRRVVNLDPFFHYAYLYGAGALAWNLHRPDEAVDLIKTGLLAMNKYGDETGADVQRPVGQLNLYLSAIIYQKTEEFGKMISFLETAVRQPGCPALVKSILANIYQKERRYAESLALWLELHESDDPAYQVRSEEKIAELRKILSF